MGLGHDALDQGVQRDARRERAVGAEALGEVQERGAVVRFEVLEHRGVAAGLEGPLEGGARRRVAARIRQEYERVRAHADQRRSQDLEQAQVVTGIGQHGEIGHEVLDLAT